MDAEFFSNRVDAFQKRIASLFDYLQDPEANNKIYMRESFIELAKALEKLETAEAELNLQASGLEQFRVQAEIERNNYLGFLQLIPDGYLVTDPDGVIRLSNPAAGHKLRKAMESLVGKPLISWVIESDRSTFQSHVRRVREEATVQTFELRINRDDNAWESIRFTASPVRDGLSEVNSIQWLLRDENPYADHAEEVFRDRFYIIFQIAPVGILLLDQNGFILDSNTAAQRLLGYDQETLKRCSFVDYIAPEDLENLVTQYFRLSHQERDHFHQELKLINQKRGTLPTRITITRYKSSDDPAGFAIAMLEDLTAKKDTSRKITEPREFHFKNSLALRQSLAQDLKSGPLEELSLILHRLENISQSNTDQTGELEEIRMALQYTLASLTEKANDLAANGPVPFDLQEAITGLMEQLKWEKPSLTYMVECDPILHSVSEPIRLELFNIFSMIIQNRVRQFRPAWFEVHAQYTQDTIVIEIQDDGPSENLPVQPESMIREGKFEYAQAAEQVEMLHGHISSSEALNSRSTIRIVIPWKQQQAKGKNGYTKKAKQKESEPEALFDNKLSNSKILPQAPFDLSDDPPTLYIPYDNNHQQD